MLEMQKAFIWFTGGESQTQRDPTPPAAPAAAADWKLKLFRLLCVSLCLFFRKSLLGSASEFLALAVQQVAARVFPWERLGAHLEVSVSWGFFVVLVTAEVGDHIHDRETTDQSDHTLGDLSPSDHLVCTHTHKAPQGTRHVSLDVCSSQTT